MSAVQCIAKKRPVKICTIRHSPSSDPKFHHLEIFLGAGRSTSALFAIFISGCIFRKGLFICYYVISRKGPKNKFLIFTTAIRVMKRQLIKITVIQFVGVLNSLTRLIFRSLCSFSVVIACSISLFSHNIAVILLEYNQIEYKEIAIIIMEYSTDFIDIENISFDANDVTQMNRTSIPPIKIMKRM